jgi:hypothetical protein
MANLLRAHRIPGIVIAVDTWLGSYDHWLQPEWFASLRIENGYPSLFQTFTANVVGRDLQDFILPLPVDSANAAKIVEQRKLRPNLLHIDGSTDYNSVMADLTAWWPLLAEGGWLIGDDYSPNDPSWPGVTRAYHDFFKQTELENHDGKCRIRKL